VRGASSATFFRADEDYGRRVAAKLGVDVGELMEAAAEGR
jgi:hypothetical protein